MQIDVLRYYLAVCDSGSIALAARRLNLTQQGLSKAMQSLELELGVELLNRSRGGGSTPTEAGREFYDSAEQIIQAWDAARFQMTLHGSGNVDDPSLSLHLDILLTTYVMNNLPGLFEGAPVYGGLSVEKGTLSLFETDFIDIGPALAEDPDDKVAIANLCPSIIDDLSAAGSLTFEPFLESDILIVCRKGFFVGPKKVLTKDDLTGIPFALHSDRVLTAILRDYLGTGFNLVSKASDFSKVAAMVARNEAVTIVDTLRASSSMELFRGGYDSGELECIPITDPPKTIVGFIRPVGTQRSSLCRIYEKAIKERAAALYHNFYIG